VACIGSELNWGWLMTDLDRQIHVYFEEVNPPFQPDDLIRQTEPMATPLRTRSGRIGLRRSAVVFVAAFLVFLVVIGGAALLLQLRSPTVPDPADNAPPVTSVLPEEPDRVLPPGIADLAIQGLASSGDMLWTWDDNGQSAVYTDGSWEAVPPLSDPIVDIAGSLKESWALTTNRCDPTVAGFETLPCETTLWRMVDGAWEELPLLDGMNLPDDLEAIEPAPDGGVLIVSASGSLFAWDPITGGYPFPSNEMHIDTIAVTENHEGEVTLWASRFNPFFPDDIGFARGIWDAFNPVDGENHHAVMTKTSDGDLWVWFSQFPASRSMYGRALAFYDSRTDEWTIHESDLPENTVRAMAASTEEVWLACDDGQLRRFDGQTWTLVTDSRSDGEVLDVGLAGDGTVWYVAGSTLKQLEP